MPCIDVTLDVSHVDVSGFADVASRNMFDMLVTLEVFQFVVVGLASVAHWNIEDIPVTAAKFGVSIAGMLRFAAPLKAFVMLDHAPVHH